MGLERRALRDEAVNGGVDRLHDVDLRLPVVELPQQLEPAVRPPVPADRALCYHHLVGLHAPLVVADRRQVGDVPEHDVEAHAFFPLSRNPMTAQISRRHRHSRSLRLFFRRRPGCKFTFSSVGVGYLPSATTRSEEHTSELQSPYDLVCRLLLEK